MDDSHYFAKFEEGRFYHVYNRANSNFDKLFFETRNYSHFLQKFHNYLSPFLNVWAYCLIPNHFHFLIRIKEVLDVENGTDTHDLLSEKFRAFFISYTQAINRQENRRGSLFHKRFCRILVDSEDYLSWLIHYIHNNPIHHHLSNDLLSWRFNSYLAQISYKDTNLARAEVLEWFGGRNEFIKFHQENKDYFKISKYLIED